MINKGINLGMVKASNRFAILQILNRQGAMSRKDIAESIGLTSASVTIICNELLEEGLIEELGAVKGEKKAGRKKILISLNKNYKYVICIGIEAQETYLSLTNIAGEILSSFRIPTDASIAPEEFFGSIAERIKTQMWEQQIIKDQILAVGVSIPGKVDKEQGISLNSYSIWNEEVPIKAILEKKLSIPVLVENNVRAYARMEILFGNGRNDNQILVLKWGPGVGAALIIDNEVYFGATGSAAEVGHMTVRRTGKPCKCGRRGCLETEISTHGIINSVLEAYGDTEESQNEMPALKSWLAAGNQISYRNTAEWGVLPDKKLQEVLSQKIERLAIIIRNAAGLMDPDKIVVWGYLFEIPGFLDQFRAFYEKYDAAKREDFIVESELVARTAHTEALSVVLDKLYFNDFD
jgi:predicted NBD/HSP70 family sugar kinase